MKRLLVLALLVLLAVPVTATQITFDHLEDYNNSCSCFISDTPHGTECLQVLPGGAGNGYVLTGTHGTYQTATFQLKTGASSKYAAVTGITGGSSNNVYSVPYNSIGAGYGSVSATGNARYEWVVSGSTASLFKDGVYAGNVTSLATDPYWMGFGLRTGVTAPWTTTAYDDYIYGTSEDTHILSIPDPSSYILLKDILGSIGEGLAYENNNTIISSTTLTTRYGRSAIYDNENESIVLRNVLTQTVYETQYLPAGGNYAGTVNWNLTAFFDSGAPYGFYEVAIPSSGSDSEDIYYGAVGATVTFDHDVYTTTSTAGITYTVTDSGTPSYWTPGAYDYRIDVISATTGETYCSENIATSTGAVSCAFESDDTVGTVWAILIAKDKITNEDLWMGYDYADLNSYVSFVGYVNSELGTPISGANVNITQGSITDYDTTIADGNYSLTGYISGSTLTFNVTASGYGQYYTSLLPLSPKEIPLNFTLVSLTRSAAGSTIGGVARDGILTGINITNGYGRPIEGATVYIKNTTNSESYTRTTNVAGYYVCGETESCILTPSRLYDLWGSKGGYNNSPNYTVVAG